MRNRLFFFRSSAPSSGNNNEIPQPATEKQVYWENPFESGLNSGNTKNSNRSLVRGNKVNQSHVLHKTRSTDYDPVIPISIEEERLRERVWELSEQNVSLQREVSSFHERKAESRKFELKAETLLTNLLLEKLYSMESEVEQLQAELAAAVRGNDILRAEVQNTRDDLSYATHKLKDLELQMVKKDENINCLQTDYEESTKQLTIMKGMLPKVSGDRDMLWERVKQCSEENMLLKKKIEALEEDLLLKDGQITILKDWLGNKFF